mmetsp:Transcript_34443/g.53770  ORF Transcript_34443/g.53770 Transcript_34443/m.53770 type:complete len:113 (+) Transcript_34443:326-664(+)
MHSFFQFLSSSGPDRYKITCRGGDGWSSGIPTCNILGLGRQRQGKFGFPPQHSPVWRVQVQGHEGWLKLDGASRVRHVFEDFRVRVESPGLGLHVKGVGGFGFLNHFLSSLN